MFASECVCVLHADGKNIHVEVEEYSSNDQHLQLRRCESENNE